MIDAGIPEKDAMYISGHKTMSILHGYKLVNRQYLRREVRILIGELLIGLESLPFK